MTRMGVVHMIPKAEWALSDHIRVLPNFSYIMGILQDTM